MSSALADALGRREVRASDRRAVSKAGSPASKAGSPAVDPRTRLLLQGSIVPTLLRLAWPNMLVMLAQASTGLIETWWVSHLGTDALAGMALVFPVFMMMQMGPPGCSGRSSPGCCACSWRSASDGPHCASPARLPGCSPPWRSRSSFMA
jgi:hypothetical protein